MPLSTYWTALIPLSTREIILVLLMWCLAGAIVILIHHFAGLRQSYRALREAEQTFQLLVQESGDYVIYMLDPQGRVTTWNAGAERIKGYKAEEIIGKHFSVFYTPEDVREGRPQQNLQRAAEAGRCENEGWRVRKDGSRFWADAVLTTLRDKHGRVVGFSKITRDVSERREMEQALRKANEELESRVRGRTELLSKINEDLKAEIQERERAERQLKDTLEQVRVLAARLEKVREEERASIAREVHDELGQALTAIKMDLFFLLRKISEHETQTRARLASTIKLVDETIQSVRRIARKLRPGLLDDLGLGAALEWEAEEFHKRTGILCRVRTPDTDFTLDDDLAITLFRIFQEALTNVARHSGATSVEAKLIKNSDYVTLEVHDNGQGIPRNAASMGKSLGIVGMRERAQLLKGEFRIRSEAGGGTTVAVTLPLGGPSGSASVQ